MHTHIITMRTTIGTTMARYIKSKKLLILPILVSIFGVAIFFVIHWTSQSNEAVIYEPKQGIADTVKSDLQTLTTPYFSMQIPSGDTPQWRTEKDAKKIQVFIPRAKKSASYAIQSDALPAGGLTGVGDINMRIKDTESYEPVQFEEAPKNSLGFWQSGDGRSDKTMSIYVPFNGRYLSLTVASTSYSYYEFIQDIKQIIQSLQIN